MAILLVSPISLANGDDRYNDSVVTLFNKAAEKHKGKFESLMEMRGRNIKDNTASLSNVLYALSRYEQRTTMLFYDQEGKTLRIWAISNFGNVQLKEIQISKEELEEKIYGFRRSINTLGFQMERSAKPKRGVVIANSKEAKATGLQEISQLLLPNEFHGTVRYTENLLIVPTLGIGSVPFALLKFTGRARDQLIDSVSITVLPSLFDTDNALPFRTINAPSIPKALIVGNPSFSNDPDWDFPQLPGAEKEAKIVSEYFKSVPLIGKDATKWHVLKEIELVDVIYFATHGVASVHSPLEESFIALSGSNKIDSRLTAREIQSLSLQAKLVVLSACQTGLGKVDEAGIIGLARAFKIAGADEVVVSLWNVDDQVTTELMTSFMKHYLNSTNHASNALKAAMLEIKEKYIEPRLWAPFIVFSGKGTIIEY